MKWLIAARDMCNHTQFVQGFSWMVLRGIREGTTYGVMDGPGGQSVAGRRPPITTKGLITKGNIAMHTNLRFKASLNLSQSVSNLTILKYKQNIRKSFVATLFLKLLVNLL